MKQKDILLTFTGTEKHLSKLDHPMYIQLLLSAATKSCEKVHFLYRSPEVSSRIGRRHVQISVVYSNTQDLFDVVESIDKHFKNIVVDNGELKTYDVEFGLREMMETVDVDYAIRGKEYANSAVMAVKDRVTELVGLNHLVSAIHSLENAYSIFMHECQAPVSKYGTSQQSSSSIEDVKTFFL